MSSARPVPGAGLCNECRHQQIVTTRRSRFSLCGRSRDDPRFPRYPVLPVWRCVGFEPREERPSTDLPSFDP